jgi:hypothetical protein
MAVKKVTWKDQVEGIPLLHRHKSYGSRKYKILRLLKSLFTSETCHDLGTAMVKNARTAKSSQHLLQQLVRDIIFMDVTNYTMENINGIIHTSLTPIVIYECLDSIDAFIVDVNVSFKETPELKLSEIYVGCPSQSIVCPLFDFMMRYHLTPGIGLIDSRVVHLYHAFGVEKLHEYISECGKKNLASYPLCLAKIHHKFGEDIFKSYAMESNTALSDTKRYLNALRVIVSGDTIKRSLRKRYPYILDSMVEWIATNIRRYDPFYIWPAGDMLATPIDEIYRMFILIYIA